jgi:hypothetical protein
MWGRSLSKCVQDILDEKVRYEDVEGIVASTLLMTTSALEDWAKRNIFGYDPKTVSELLYCIWNDGKLYQPRLNKNVAQSTVYPAWCDTFEEAYASLEEYNG